MSNLVFLISSLPALSYGQVPPITLDEFINDAKTQLSDRHFQVLEQVDLRKMRSDVKHGDAKAIGEMLNDLQMDISEIRKANTRQRGAKLKTLPRSIVNANPLEREMQMMHWQWEVLSDLESGKAFSFTEVLVYKLKLQILCRLQSFDKKEGAKVLASVVDPNINKKKE